MAEIKVVIGQKDGKSLQIKVSDEYAPNLYSKKIGEKVKGEELGIEDLEGYEFEITGGSDSSGFPMRKDIPIAGKMKLLSKKSRGFNLKRKGLRKKKSVAGSIIYEKTAQVNLKVIKEGKKPLIKEDKKEENQKEDNSE
ncbi:MAG: small subunit ribosomal protein S6e [Candidatus Woesearchaeota archaeon]|nr:small subunit ribosomal protein S6e [Candidatus Woesearchaeota archaeon]